MSTFLQLVNFSREESGASGGDLTALTSVTGESKRYKNWVIRAWEEIQQMETEWKWMRASYSFATTANDGDYTSAQAGISTRFEYWDRSYCTVYLTASGVSDQTKLTWLDYEIFRDYYLTGPQTSGRPTHWSIGDANELLIGPEPDSALYTIAGKYKKSPQILSADADEPELPEMHNVIAYRAMKKAGRYKAAPEIYNDAKSSEGDLLAKLRAKYLPAIQFGGPLL